MDDLKQRLARAVAPYTDGMAAAQIAELFSVPKPEFGDVALPCFRVAVGGLKKPNEKSAKLAADLAEAIADGHDLIATAEPAGGYLNFTLRASAMAAAVLPAVDELADGGFVLPDGRDKFVAIDYSSPNVAKEFSLGHLRSTMLGHSLIELHKALGWETAGVNHLGDWGHQFGVVIVAYREEGDEAELEADPIRHLQGLYVRYSQREKAEAARKKCDDKDVPYDAVQTFGGKRAGESEEAAARVGELLAADPYLREPKLPDDSESVTARAREVDVALQRGDADVRELWTRFRELSLDALKTTYADLGVQFDAYTGESFFEDKMDHVVDLAQERGILVESEGAQVVQIEGQKAPCILLKRDGGTTYATRDLAAAIYRRDEYRFDRNLYVVDKRQSHHFAQVFAVLGLMGYDWAEACGHISFGAVRIAGEVMSTRAGNVVLLEDYIAVNTERITEIMREKNPGLEAEIGADAFAQTARDVAKGAIIFEMLKVDRNQDVDYRSEEALSFEGETGPRVQMTYAKTGSVARKYAEMFGHEHDPNVWASAHYETGPERQLLRLIGDYPTVVRRALDEYQPFHLAKFVIEISDWVNRYWRETQFLVEDDEPRASSRVALLARVRRVVKQTLSLLGMAAPERM
jgi:arginyl-tRNA synthetase